MGAGLSNGVTNLVEMGVGREDTQLQPSLVSLTSGLASAATS